MKKTLIRHALCVYSYYTLRTCKILYDLQNYNAVVLFFMKQC